MHIYLWQIDPLLQLSIDALHTTTPNLGHFMADLYMYIEQCKHTYVRLTPSNQAEISTKPLHHISSPLL